MVQATPSTFSSRVVSLGTVRNTLFLPAPTSGGCYHWRLGIAATVQAFIFFFKKKIPMRKQQPIALHFLIINVRNTEEYPSAHLLIARAPATSSHLPRHSLAFTLPLHARINHSKQMNVLIIIMIKYYFPRRYKTKQDPSRFELVGEVNCSTAERSTRKARCIFGSNQKNKKKRQQVSIDLFLPYKNSRFKFV